MNTQKPWYSSVTIWGVFLAALGTALSRFPEVSDWLVSESASEAFAAFGTFVGLVIAAWGRLRATSVIAKQVK